MSALTDNRYRIDARKTREGRLTPIKPRSMTFTNLTEAEARGIAEFLVDRDVPNVPGVEVLAVAAGSIQVTITEISDTPDA